MKDQKYQIIILVTLIVVTALWRVTSTQLGLYNFIPMAAIGLFSGSVFTNKGLSYLIPLSTMLLSDSLFAVFTTTQGFYGFSQFINYGALALVTLLGTFLKHRNPLSILGYTLSGSMLFFVISNFGTFLTGYYGYSWQGLVTCYEMAMPFYKYEMATQFFVSNFISDLIFSILAFSVFYLLKQRKVQYV